MKTWVPTFALAIILIILVAASRIYIGGPDGIEIVWKGELNFADTIVNLADYAGLTKKEFAQHPALYTQMDEMGLIETSDFHRAHKRHGKKDESGTASGKDASDQATDQASPNAKPDGLSAPDHAGIEKPADSSEKPKEATANLEDSSKKDK